MYGGDHALMVKYYAFISLQESIEDKAEALKALRPVAFEFIKRISSQHNDDSNDSNIAD